MWAKTKGEVGYDVFELAAIGSIANLAFSIVHWDMPAGVINNASQRLRTARSPLAAERNDCHRKENANRDHGNACLHWPCTRIAPQRKAGDEKHPESQHARGDQCRCDIPHDKKRHRDRKRPQDHKQKNA